MIWVTLTAYSQLCVCVCVCVCVCLKQNATLNIEFSLFERCVHIFMISNNDVQHVHCRVVCYIVGCVTYFTIEQLRIVKIT